MRLTAVISATLAALLALSAGQALAGSADMQWAEENLKAGRYDDAAKKLLAVIEAGDDAEKPKAREMLADLCFLTGKYDKVVEIIEEAGEPGVGELLSVGRAHMARGRYEEAEKAFQAAFEKSEKKSAVARVELIDCYTVTGQTDLAELARNWFFQSYSKIGKINYGRADKSKVEDPEELIALGRAMAPRDPQGAINAFTVAEQKDPENVEPFVRSFFLFMEKFAWAEGEKELGRAMKVDKRDLDVRLGVAYVQWSRKQNAEAAEKALRGILKINPNMVRARVMLAQLALFDDEFEEAKKELDAALAVNPNDPEALSVLAAYHHDTGNAEEFKAVCEKVLGINPGYSDLYNTIASACERKRQFPSAQKFYLKALEIDPDDWQAHYGAGMSQVRRGEDAEGKKRLEKAFALNKYNLFCRNILVVLDKIIPPEGAESQFESLATEHFLIWAPKKDAAFILPYMARCMEEGYDRFSAKYQMVPEGPIVVECFSKHSDFSARTTGLPLIGADGACFGKLITLDSPRVWQAGSVGKFNWAAVATHELMHVFSLQKTDFRIPRWFTEGLSVYEEVIPRIELDPLFTAAARTGRLIKVKDLNRQMTRPSVPTNPLLAYYQGRRIVEHLYEKHGAEGVEKLLAEFKAGRKLEEAVKNALGLSLEEFEAQVLEHQQRFAVEKIKAPGAVDKAGMLKLRLAVQENPKDPLPQARLAEAHLLGQKPNHKAAKEAAEKALALGTEAPPGPGAALAYAVLGRVSFDREKKYRQARDFFQKAVALDPDNFSANLYLGRCASKEGIWPLAIQHLEKARDLYPRCIATVNPYDELYKAYRDMEDKNKSLEVLRQRVEVDKLNADPAIRLGKLALAAEKPDLAAWAAWQAVKVDPFAADPHIIWGRAAEAARNYEVAEREWRLATTASPTDADSKLGLARVLLMLGRKEEARAAAGEARAIEPDQPDIKAFIEALGPPDAIEEKPEELKPVVEPVKEGLEPGTRSKDVAEVTRELEKLLEKLREKPKDVTVMTKELDKLREKSQEIKPTDDMKELIQKIEKQNREKETEKKEAEKMPVLEKVDAAAPLSQRAA